MNEKCAIWGGVLLGGLALAFFGSEGLVQFYRHGMGSGGSSAGSGSSGTGAVAVSANVSASSSSSSS